MHIVITKVGVQEGKIKEVLEKLGDRNPELVRNQEGWIKATFTANYQESSITVLAYWKSDTSYIHFSQSEEFRNAMKDLQHLFTSEPKVDINKMLFEI